MNEMPRNIFCFEMDKSGSDYAYNRNIIDFFDLHLSVYANKANNYE